MEKNEKLNQQNEQRKLLIEAAGKLKDKGMEFVVRRNNKNVETGEVTPGKTERGWKILDINQTGLVTVYNKNNSEIFHIPIDALEQLNADIFKLADSL